ncbi:hypothetical protein [Spongiimicrobium salis]|uniref:hypothetical protein n=1 Tax=Spongiimicrobium salis TaxID=1667022 RepID=UPI00374D707F
MPKKLLLPVLLLIMSSCLRNVDDEIVDCALFDPAIPIITITYVDADGNNLIRNETFNADDIEILRADGSVGGGVILPRMDEEMPENNPFNYTLWIALPRSETETYRIQLTDMVTDELQFTAQRQNLPCGLSYFIPISGTYNGTDITIVEDTIDFRIRIVVE